MTDIADLVLERRDQTDQMRVAADGPHHDTERTVVLLTPPITEDYWAYRVIVADGQAVVGFPKFFTVGIGFAVEEDWNTNLPYTSDAPAIAAHIWHNRAPLPDDEDAKALVVHAITLIQQAVTEDIEKARQSA